MPRYEQISELTGVRIPPFADANKDEVLNMKHLVMKYMQDVLNMQKQLQAGGTGKPVEITTGVGVVALAPAKKYTLGRTENGFPTLPQPMNTQGWSKQVWEKLHMEYMCCHYSEWPVNNRA